MVKGCDFQRAKDRQRFMRELLERQPDAVERGGSRSTPNVVMNFLANVYKKQAEEERFLCARRGPGRCQWGGTDDPACPTAGFRYHEA